MDPFDTLHMKLFDKLQFEIWLEQEELHKEHSGTQHKGNLTVEFELSEADHNFHIGQNSPHMDTHDVDIYVCFFYYKAKTLKKGLTLSLSLMVSLDVIAQPDCLLMTLPLK